MKNPKGEALHKAKMGKKVSKWLSGTSDIREGKVSVNELDKGRTGSGGHNMRFDEKKNKYVRK